MPRVRRASWALGTIAKKLERCTSLNLEAVRSCSSHADMRPLFCGVELLAFFTQPVNHHRPCIRGSLNQVFVIRDTSSRQWQVKLKQRTFHVQHKNDLRHPRLQERAEAKQVTFLSSPQEKGYLAEFAHLLPQLTSSQRQNARWRQPAKLSRRLWTNRQLHEGSSRHGRKTWRGRAIFNEARCHVRPGPRRTIVASIFQPPHEQSVASRLLAPQKLVEGNDGMQLVEVNDAEQAAPKGGRAFHLEFEVRVIVQEVLARCEGAALCSLRGNTRDEFLTVIETSTPVTLPYTVA